jgi:hypothetical protein
MTHHHSGDPQETGVLVSLAISIGMIALAMIGVWLWQMRSDLFLMLTPVR